MRASAAMACMIFAFVVSNSSMKSGNDKWLTECNLDFIFKVIATLKFILLEECHCQIPLYARMAKLKHLQPWKSLEVAKETRLQTRHT